MPNDSRSVAAAIADLRRRIVDAERLEVQALGASSIPAADTIVKSGTAGTIALGWIPSFSGTTFLAGTVGVGTAAPTYPLHVIGTASVGALRVNNQVLTVGGSSYISGSAVVTSGSQDIAGNKNFTGTVQGAAFVSNLSVMYFLLGDRSLNVSGNSLINGTAVVTTGNQSIAGAKTFTGTVNATVLQQNSNALTVGTTSYIGGSAVVTSGNQTIDGVKTFSNNAIFSGFVQFGQESVTISGSVSSITVTQSFVQITNNHTAAVSINDIQGYAGGAFLVLKRVSSGQNVTFVDGVATAGGLQLAGNMTLDQSDDTLTLIYNTTASRWIEVSRSNNS